MHLFIFVYREAVNSNVISIPYCDSVFIFDLLTLNLKLRNNTRPYPISSWHLGSDFYPAISEGEIASYSCGENWMYNVISSSSVN
jgi:hypothetical protein